MILRSILSRRWLLTTIFVLFSSGVCVRLGIWQLDRLAGRREFNAHIESVREMTSLKLTSDIDEDLISMEYRQVEASGRYDFENQVALRNMYYGQEYGYHLLTPLVIGDGIAVIIDRGWIPAETNDNPSDWKKYDINDEMGVHGIIRVGREEPEMGGIADPELLPGQKGLDFWFNVNLDRIEDQMPYDLLPVYIQPNPESNDLEPPIPYQPHIELTEGSHIGYAIQFFSFSMLILFGYPFLIYRTENQDF